MRYSRAVVVVGLGFLALSSRTLGTIVVTHEADPYSSAIAGMVDSLQRAATFAVATTRDTNRTIELSSRDRADLVASVIIAGGSASAGSATWLALSAPQESGIEDRVNDWLGASSPADSSSIGRPAGEGFLANASRLGPG